MNIKSKRVYSRYCLDAVKLLGQLIQAARKNKVMSMMISNQKLNEAYVWIWLPEKTAPVFAGKLSLRANR